jgi:hypothetical protein
MTQRLTILQYTGKRKGLSYAVYKCACGAEKEISMTSVRLGRTKSCGCLQRETVGALNRSHGRWNTFEYRVYHAMLQRCYNSNRSGYSYYGGKGITVCDSWKESFDNFLADMGECPADKSSIDRIDGTKEYSKDNCRWATKSEQSYNQ